MRVEKSISRTLILVAMMTICVAGVGCEKQIDEEAIAAVQATFTKERPNLWYQTGALEEGTAVLTSSNASYWVKDGVVYAANSAAAATSPGIERAPKEISYDLVQSAVGRSR